MVRNAAELWAAGKPDAVWGIRDGPPGPKIQHAEVLVKRPVHRRHSAGESGFGAAPPNRRPVVDPVGTET
jgi:hypothetical protein